MGNITETVKVLLIANILFFVGSQFLGDYAYQLLALWFPENENFQLWQIVTHMFMHGGFSHILFNMFALYMFGSVLEQTLGQQRFLFLYFSAGLGAAGLQILFSYWSFNSAMQTYLDAGLSSQEVYDMLSQYSTTGKVYASIPREATQQLISTYMTPMVGASGAIFGVLAAFAVVYPNLPLYLMFVPIPIKAKYLIGGYFAINVYSAVTGTTLLGPSNTAYWAHIGGAIIGFITMWYWKKNSFNSNRWN
ncbi:MULTISPECIES: rhomboid family intramembrane serine protease [Mesonia]|uniref:Membrane associated rhomboid family serine protease n=1 Tax=Mesonia algae TaxID=213248 RepID=A0A2W7I192_9FLAO|nr:MULTISPECIES: rhomboid family intramembrane serine protease [Mesonia]PZW40701.1 membrane associated rhomboid family serine protease [Mesonia algae]TXK73071.1 rhomboid family intramembrane serine protease [Mesonia sp. K4-1]